MHRLEKYNISLASNIVSKSFLFTGKTITIKKLSLTAGLYKPTSLEVGHNLILSAISGSLASTATQLHGKRQKKTLSLSSYLTKIRALQAIDKITHEVLPRMIDLKSPKLKRPLNAKAYTLRIRQKFTPLVDFDDLVDNEMFETHKGIFLPLVVHFSFAESNYSQISELYLRMLRLPLLFYRKQAAPAFDDPVDFEQVLE